MTNVTNKKFAGLRTVFAGDSVFSIEVKSLDQNHDKKPDELKIAKQATHFAIKALVVNEIKAVKLPGDIDGLLINGGGTSGLTFGANDSFASESQAEPTKKWFSDYNIVKSIVRASNESEIIRLKLICEETKLQWEALEAINQANEDAAQRYE